jgi:hypothetical protein
MLRDYAKDRPAVLISRSILTNKSRFPKTRFANPIEYA